MARTRDRRELHFSVAGTAEAERPYRTTYISPAFPAWKRALVEREITRAPDLLVIDSVAEWNCRSCGETGRYLFMEGEGPLCLGCAKLDHLVFLPRGDADLTRRAKDLSGLYAVVVRFSRVRKRYERQGLFVEPGALEGARAGEGGKGR